jgi:hypothetical protein
MKSASLAVAAIACAAMIACDSTSPDSSLVSDAIVSADIDASTADAVAASLDAMLANEAAGGFASLAALAAAPLVEYSGTVTCYDANNTVVANCSPKANVRKIVRHVQITGSRSGSREKTGGSTVTWSGAVHRIADDTIVRNFTGAEEVSRTHSNLVVTHDTTTFADGDISRFMSEAARDTVKALTWNLPRSTNPFPVSGSIVRVDSIKVTASGPNRTESRELVRVLEVDFPADGQGNVVLKVNGKTCNLNLVTRKVSNCQ